MINDIRDIEWDQVRSYSIDRQKGILDEITLTSGFKFNVSHLNVNESDVEYYMNGGVLRSSAPVQQYTQPTQAMPMQQNQGYEQPQQNYQQQPSQNRGSNAGAAAGNYVMGSVQWFIIVMFTALGAFVAFSFHLAKRLIVDKLDLTIVEVFTSAKEKFSSIFGESTGDYFPDITSVNEKLTVYDQVSTIIAFCLLGLPLLFQIIKRPSKIISTVIFYVVSLIIIASVYNLGVSNDFLEIMGNFPPLMSLNPLSLFGYLGS